MGTRTDLFWRLDASKLPQRLDLEISDRAYERLQRLASRTGRSVRDLAADLIAQSFSPRQGRV
jgi:predicted transcriptional regulator